MGKHPCAWCRFRDKTTKTCDYILMVGHRRPCPPGPECTVKETKRRRSPWTVSLKRKQSDTNGA